MATKRSLGSGAVVDRIIREFAAEVLRNTQRKDFMAWLSFECLRMNNLFTGVYGSDKYVQGPWNCEDRVGSFVHSVFVIDGETRFAVRDAFMIFKNALLKLVKEGGAFDDARRAKLDEMVGEMRDALLGTSTGVARSIINR
jgi:hypothetical protein